jgi:hypothetical protein
MQPQAGSDLEATLTSARKSNEEIIFSSLLSRRCCHSEQPQAVLSIAKEESRVALIPGEPQTIAAIVTPRLLKAWRRQRSSYHGDTHVLLFEIIQECV